MKWKTKHSTLSKQFKNQTPNRRKRQNWYL